MAVFCLAKHASLRFLRAPAVGRMARRQILGRKSRSQPGPECVKLIRTLLLGLSRRFTMPAHGDGTDRFCVAFTPLLSRFFGDWIGSRERCAHITLGPFFSRPLCPPTALTRPAGNPASRRR